MLRTQAKLLRRLPPRRLLINARNAAPLSTAHFGAAPGKHSIYSVTLFAIASIAGGYSLYTTAQHASTQSIEHCDASTASLEQATNVNTIEIRTHNGSDSSEEEKPWGSWTDRVKDVIVPTWVAALPDLLQKLQEELSSKPGTLAAEMWQEAHDPQINPEILRPATVRVSTELCAQEKTFIRRRKEHLRGALATYLDIPEGDIHPDDIPTIAMCGSGGGLRALVAGSSSYLSTKEAGLFDCVTYTAGVSGSCWLQNLYYSSITGQRHDRIIDHLKSRIGVHIAFPPDFLKLLTSSPTSKYLLSGGYEKYRGVEKADFGLVDLYGLLLGARLLVPKGDLAVNDRDLKLSNQAEYISNGQNPMPIYTAVRHEIPAEDENTASKRERLEKAKKEAWFQWFEFTPYEFWCEELNAGIPTWSVGRNFENGHSLWRDNGLALPELRAPLLMGIFGSAFCATLSHYYREVKPLMKGLLSFGGLEGMIDSQNNDLEKVHPIDPATIPNFALGMRGRLPDSTPESLYQNDVIQLMDAGMSNNLPIYPLLRPGRKVDILIAFDASADVKTDNWLRVADGYAKQRGIKGWPIGTGWPDQEDDTVENLAKGLDEADESAINDSTTKLKQASNDQDDARKSDPAASKEQEESVGKHELGYCNIWVGTTEERVSKDEAPKSKLVDEDWQLMTPDAGLAVIYFPFMPNPKVEGVDPRSSDFMSTWNFIYTPDNIDKVVSLARQNFQEGAERTKMAVRAVYERKKKQRLERESNERQQRWEIASGV